jgi:hypothetical protein
MHSPANNHLNTEVILYIDRVCNLLNFPPIFKVGSTRNFKPAGSMLMNTFGSHVPSDLLILENAQSIQIKKIRWFIGSKLLVLMLIT